MTDTDLLDRMMVKANRPSDKKDAPSLEKVMNILRSKRLDRIAEPVLKFRTLPPLENEPTIGKSRLGGNPGSSHRDSLAYMGRQASRFSSAIGSD